MSGRPDIISFDGEAVRLHGMVFAIGAVLLRADGAEETFYARCLPTEPLCPFVVEHVVPALDRKAAAASARGGLAPHHPFTHQDARLMRDDFWWWLTERQGGALVVGDCGWPLETGLLSACVRDDPKRELEGVYPLHEVASLLLAAGMDPKGSYADHVLSPEALVAHVPHDPVCDARVSALCARMALDVIWSWRDRAESADVARAAL